MKKATLAAVLLLLLLAACNWTEGRRLATILEVQHSRYPFMTLQDTYKLLYQAAMGSEHAVTDRGMAEKYLAAEMVSLTGRSGYYDCEGITPSGDLVRVHLRPYVEAGQDTQELIEAFAQTAATFEGSIERLERYWEVATRAAGDGRLPYSESEMNEYFAARAAEGHQAVHHSQRFQAAYRPAYRVVRRDLLNIPCRD